MSGEGMPWRRESGGDEEPVERRSGRTTRRIDAAVQTLFVNGQVTWEDHAISGAREAAEAGSDLRYRQMGFRKLVSRLTAEHSQEIEVDKENFTIRLKR